MLRLATINLKLLLRCNECDAWGSWDDVLKFFRGNLDVLVRQDKAAMGRK